MSIFDIFTFKKDANKVFSISNFKQVLSTAREAIIEEIKSNIPGPEKKIVVDAIVLAKIDCLTTDVSNKLVLWLLGLVKVAIPSITQTVYDFLKEKVENL